MNAKIFQRTRTRGGAGLDWARGIPHRPGAYTFTTSGTTRRRPFPALNDDERVRHKGELAYPNLFLSLACDHAAVFILEPKSAARTDIVCHFLFEPFEMDKSDFDPRDATAPGLQACCESGRPATSATVPARPGRIAPKPRAGRSWPELTGTRRPSQTG